MKVLTGLFCAILFAIISMTTDAQAYTLTNNTVTSGTITLSDITIEAMCGPFGLAGFGPYSLSPGASMDVVIPPGCTVTGIKFRGVVYPVGYNGPIAPPNPPNAIIVTATGALFL